MIQGSVEWRALRAGKVTASRVTDVMARTKSGYGAGRKNYLAELVVERLTGVPTEGFTSAAMRYGTEMEPLARSTYEFYHNETVEQVAFVPHPTIALAGCSPDGLIGTEGGIEIKCPNTATHLETLLNGTIDDGYVKQMQFQMACTGRKWIDFVSFDSRVQIPEMQLWVRRVPRDDMLIMQIQTEVIAFLKEVDATIHQLRGMYLAQEAA